MTIEAVLLTGGASRRMGEDKAKLLIDGVPQAKRIADSLLGAGIPVTTLGREPIEGCAFVADTAEFAGPLAALARFQPTADAVFVASCDLPRFDVQLVDLLASALGDSDAAIPFVNGFRQPLCALYRASAFDQLDGLNDACTMGWVDALACAIVTEEDLRTAGIHPLSTQGANTRSELQEMLEGS